MRFALLLMSVFFMAATTAEAEITTDTVRQRAQQACYDDVTKLCNDDIPDEAKITACMERNKTKLSAGCLKIFNAGIK